MSRHDAERQRAGIRRRAIESLTLNIAAEVLETGDPLEAILASHLRQVSPHLDPERLAEARRRVRARGEGQDASKGHARYLTARNDKRPSAGRKLRGEHERDYSRGTYRRAATDPG